MINVFEDFASRQPGGGAITIRRRATGTPAYTAGYPTPDGAFVEIPIIAQVSPTDGRGLKILADQGITSESQMLLTATKMFSRTKTAEPDQVIGFDLDDGDMSLWTVYNVMTYTAPDTDRFYKVIVARDDPQ